MVNCSEAIGPFIYLFEFITRRIELNKTMKKNIAFYYLSDATMKKKENIAFYYLKYIKGH